MTEPLFSVIIPTYRRPELLAKAVRSVLAQTINDLECLVVDDASPERPEVPHDPRVRVVRRKKNEGEPAARNTGLKQAKGRYVAFLDDDDRYTPGRLVLALEGLARAPVSVCFRAGMDGVASGNRRLEGEVHDVILNGLTPQMGQVAVHRNLMPRFDESFPALTDVDWWLRASADHAVATVPEVGLLYRRHDGPRNRNGTEERIRCSLLLMEKHEEYFRAHPRASAFRWRRIGLMAGLVGDFALARRALLRSLHHAASARALLHLGRAVRPTRAAVSTVDRTTLEAVDG